MEPLASKYVDQIRQIHVLFNTLTRDERQHNLLHARQRLARRLSVRARRGRRSRDTLAAGAADIIN